MPQGSRAAIPSLSGPTLTCVLIASVDPKLEDCGGRWEEKGGKGVSKSLAWQASVSCSCWRDTCAQPPYTLRAGGWAGSLLPSRASCLFPASTAPKARAVLGPGARQRCRQEAALPPTPPPAPFVSRCPPHPPPNHHLSVCTSPPFIPAPRFAHAHSLLHYLWASPQSPPLHTHLQTRTSLASIFASTALLCTGTLCHSSS